MARGRPITQPWTVATGPAPDPRAGARRSGLGRAIPLLFVVALAGAGCSGRGTYITGGPSTGQLKSSLSHLEFQNEQLRTQLARLKEENREFEDRLVQERLHTDELVTKLDNARNRLRDDGQGIDSDLDAPLGRAKTLPAGRSTPPKRKSPAAQISRASDQDEIPPIRIDDAPRDGRPSSRSGRGRVPRDDDADSLGLIEKDLNWIPIARGQDEPASSPKR